MHSGNIIEQRGRCVRTFTGLGEDLARVLLTPVAHDTVGAGIFGIHRVTVGRVAIAGVVVAGVRQAQGVADFVSQGLATVVAFARSFIDLVVLVDQVPRLTFARAVWQVGKGCAAIAGTEVGECHVTIVTPGCRAFGEGHFGHVCP